MTQFENMPRINLSSWPTPIEPLNRLSNFLGGPQIFMKRDDFGSLGMGGNKLRKLEYLLGEALRDKSNVIITAGALQSNHARLTAAVSARLGLDCHLILKDEVRGRSEAYRHSGNNFLDRLLGAKVTIIDANSSVPEALEKVATDYKNAEHEPYVIPIGGSNAVGSLGYVSCMHEILEQRSAEGPFTHIFATSGSGGTHAGLLIGCALRGVSTKIIGVAISRSAGDQRALVSDLVQRTTALLGVSLNTSDYAIQVDGDHYLPGYGIPNPASLEAISLCARLEGVLLDPVYTSKTMAALIALIRSKTFSPDDKILFVHTGGSPALFVYEEHFGATGTPLEKVDGS